MTSIEWVLVGSAICVNLGLIVGGYVRIRLKINALEIKSQYQQELTQKIEHELTHMNETLTDVKLILQNKADKE
jgi:hypothetical protein